MLTSRQLDNVIYAHFNLKEPVEDIIRRYCHTRRVMDDGHVYYSIKRDAYSTMKQISNAIGKRINNQRDVGDFKIFGSKKDSYYNNEMLYGNLDMLECLKDGSTYKISEIKYEDVAKEMTQPTRLHSHNDLIIKDEL